MKLSFRGSRKLLLPAFLLVIIGGNEVASAAQPLEVKIQRIVGAGDLRVEGQKAASGAILRQGQSLRTGKSRAEILFNRRAIGLVGPNTELTVGDNCYKLVTGTILVNGPQSPCIDSRRLALLNSTYVLSKQDDQSYSVTVLSGKVGVTDAAAQGSSEEINILDTYPKVASSFGTKGSGFGDAFPGGSSSATFAATYFTPLAQSRATSVLYSYTSAGYSTNDVFGVGTEIGYRKFHVSNQSTSSAYLGYSGFNGQSCFGNFVNAGAQWERSRWRIGATGGLRANECPTAFSFAAINLSAPIASYRSQPVYLSFSPYMLFGNVTDPVGAIVNGGDSNSSSFPGGRLSVEFPISQALSLRVQGSVDTVFGAQVGGSITYRIPTSGSFINDRYVTVNSSPNRPLRAIPTTPELLRPTSQENRHSLPGVATSAAESSLIAMHTSSLPAGVLPLGTVAQLQLAQESLIAKEGERLVLSTDGSIVSSRSISNREFADVLKSNLKGQNPIPESHHLAMIAKSRNVLSSQLASILGVDMLQVSSLAVSETLDTPFTPTTLMPMGRYVCAASDEAKKYGVSSIPGGFNYGDTNQDVFLGRGSETSQGYPATFNKNDAYVFASADACNRINQYVKAYTDGVPYDVVNPVKF